MQGDGRPAPGPSSASEIDLSVWQRLPDRAPDERLRAQGPRSTDEDPYSEPSSPFEPIVSSRRTMSITQFHPKEGEPNIPLTIRLDFVPPPHLQRQIHLAASRASEGKSTQSQIPFPFGFRICFGDYPLDTLVALQPLDLHQPSSQMKFMLQSVIPKRQSTLPHVPVSVQLTANHAVLDTAQIGVFMYWDTEAAPRNTTAPLPISEDRAVRSPSGPYSQLVPKGRRGDKVQNSRFVDRGLTQHVQQPNPDRQFTSPQYTHHDSSIRPQPPSLDTRSTSLPGMPHALAPSMFRNIPTPSPAPPSTPSSGHDSSAMQNSPIEERMRLPLHQETDTTPPVAQAPHSTQAPYRERSPLPRKPTPLAQRRSRRASAVQTQDSADTSTPDLGMEGEQEASSSTASTHRPRGFGARTSISGKPLIPSTLIRTSQLSSRRTTRNPVRLLMKGDLNNMALG
ncbi:uncharacterized protein EI90DRAFT_1316349 [Cantharellus anzutake]|uniref:uncharacterized protein n=1 Tax=Cantharellus anzutake TaxID=1750568 RepID=UPI001903C926|nr:uncharacterized protein EI90DRAFT_1316349 [Cantharellus anzutake]KAF8342212.1 hypothetical protein EI90DRAFT_1316349 [Cantharellus anzutake]